MDRYGLTAFLNEPIWGFPLWKVLVVVAAIAVVSFVVWLVLLIGIWCSSMSRRDKAIATALLLFTGPVNVIELLLDALLHLLVHPLARLFGKRPPERGPRLVRR